MSKSSSDTAPIRSGEELDWSALTDYLCRNLSEEQLPIDDRTSVRMDVDQFPGGHSNLTYLIRFNSREFVLRRPPFGPVAPTAHDMVREFRVLSLVHPAFPLAPRPFLVCEDKNIIGAPFYVSERKRGIVIRQEIPAEIGEDLSLRSRVSEAMIDSLADLHAVDIQETGISQIGKPVGFVERQIKGWAKRWERAKTSEIPEIETMTQWLLDRIPDPPEPTVVHNDFKLDNVMLDPREPFRVVAVLDWEMCTVGDPLIDLGLLLCYWPEPGDSDVRVKSIRAVTTQPGFLRRDQLIERYHARTGRDVSFIRFYEAFALFKVAVVVQQIYFRYHRGQTQDERFAPFEQRAVGLLQTALKKANAE